MIVGTRWLITVHREQVRYLSDFRAQDKGETDIGKLSPALLAASLLDWHLTQYFEEVSDIEADTDQLDAAILADGTQREILARSSMSGCVFRSCGRSCRANGRSSTASCALISLRISITRRWARSSVWYHGTNAQLTKWSEPAMLWSAASIFTPRSQRSRPTTLSRY